MDSSKFIHDLMKLPTLPEAERNARLGPCPWCPNFDKNDPANKNKSHTMCIVCEHTLNKQLAEKEHGNGR